mmetsp:Transcript_8721/g.15089  ORF Transcript_8721/g.15089 Transcript_8721/m.15089 type:complete len:118 (+) Transcript_8721:33-386(+)
MQTSKALVPRGRVLGFRVRPRDASSSFSRVPVLRASANEGDKRSSWDTAWRSFQKQMWKHVEPKSPLRQPAPLNARDTLKKQERYLLDLWTSEAALKYGGAAMVTGLLVVLVVAGPP